MTNKLSKWHSFNVSNIVNLLQGIFVSQTSELSELSVSWIHIYQLFMY